ncbi:hypothetical protein F3Y30_14395 [Sinorhizobium sp. BG8]|nr:hypothetical protein F3Y30_14395 [Sinorhizobium sp. BG8]
MTKTAGTNDANATPEQMSPRDVDRSRRTNNKPDDQSKAPPAVQPAGGRDESEQPTVNPVTGGAL